MSRIRRILQYSDEWPHCCSLVAARVDKSAADLSKALQAPLSLFIVSDTDLGRTEVELGRQAGISLSGKPAAQNAEAFALRVDSTFAIVVTRRVWNEFEAAGKTATATVVHELGHIEEQLSFGVFPDEIWAWNIRMVWAEFYAERIAASYYDAEDHLRGHSKGLIALTEFSLEDNIAAVSAHLGRMIGFAYGIGMDGEDFWNKQEGCDLIYREAGRKLWPILTEAFEQGWDPPLYSIEHAFEGC